MLGRSPLRSSFVSSDTVALTGYHHDDSMSTCEDPFTILGVHREASLDEIKRAYRRLAMFWHPDRNPAAVAGTEFKRVHAAYELFLDPQRLAEWQQDTGPPLLPLGEAAAVVLDAGRDWLAERIDRRFEAMVTGGALEEVRAVLDAWEPVEPWARAIGAPELVAHLRGETTLAEAIERARAASRQYAKRQRSWFRGRMRRWHWLRVP